MIHSSKRPYLFDILQKRFYELCNLDRHNPLYVRILVSALRLAYEAILTPLVVLGLANQSDSILKDARYFVRSLVRAAGNKLFPARELERHEMKPPKSAKFLLYLFFSRKTRVVLLGDLEEDFNEAIDEFGYKKARLLYWVAVLKSVGPAAIGWVMKGAILEKVLAYLSKYIAS